MISRSHVERRELERAYDRLRGSCGGAECLAALREACTRKPRCRRAEAHSDLHDGVLPAASPAALCTDTLMHLHRRMLEAES